MPLSTIDMTFNKMVKITAVKKKLVAGTAWVEALRAALAVRKVLPRRDGRHRRVWLAVGMCTNPRYFGLFVSGSKYQDSNLFELVRSRFEQSNSSDSSDSSNSSYSSDSSDHSRRWKQQNRWLRLTENSRWRIRTQQTTLFNGIWYFGVFENPAYEFDVKIKN